MFYTREDDWLTVQGDIATIGITDRAQAQLGPVLFVRLPPIGTRLVRGDEAVLIESIKAAADIYVPISGTVVQINAALEARPSLVNTASQTSGWMFCMTIADPDEIGDLLDHPTYLAHLSRA